MSKHLIGIGVAGGIALGPAVVVATEPAVSPLAAVDAAGLSHFDQAVAAVRAELTSLAARAGATLPAEVAAIIDAQRLFLDDPLLIDEIRRRITAGQAPVTALNEVRAELADLFAALPDPTLRGRLADLEAVVASLRAHLLGAAAPVLPARPFILVAATLPPALLVSLDRRLCQGLVAEGGGPTDHAAIIARLLDLPTVVGVAGLLASVRSDDPIAVDGTTGRVIVRPTPAERAALTASNPSSPVVAVAPGPVLTRDGHRVELAANIDGVASAERAFALGAEAIGLFRTEWLYMGRAALPTEAEQAAIYTAVARLAGQRQVIIRTIDIGGDKPVPSLGLPTEANPFLGLRGLRLGLARPELFRPHLRAILRAGVAGRLALLLPMVTSVEEIEQARAVIEVVRAELIGEGVALGEPLPLGVMIETPAAALIADHLAPLVDFFSVGSNDLIQYTLAADRGNPAVASLADAYHPAVLRLLRRVIEAAQAAGRWVGLCGELASQPVAVPLLVGLGFDELSCAPSMLPLVAAAIRGVTVTEARRLTERALDCPSAAAVAALLAD